MEQFSRECLEIDTAPQSKERTKLFVGVSMDKIYQRAAKLVKKTLDVEGVVVLDVSHCDVPDAVSGEGSVSVVMYNGDPQAEITSRLLSSEEYSHLNAFFLKYPDGKISEGRAPISFRPFLPIHIQYALSGYTLHPLLDCSNRQTQQLFQFSMWISDLLQYYVRTAPRMRQSDL